MIESNTDSETPPAEQQKMDPRRTFIIAWTNVIVVVCFLLYLIWEWYADPATTWQHWAWMLTQVLVFIWITSRIIAKTFAEYAPLPNLDSTRRGTRWQ